MAYSRRKDDYDDDDANADYRVGDKAAAADDDGNDDFDSAGDGHDHHGDE